MMGLFAAQTAVAGAVQVFIVVVAIDLLDLGTSGVGFLNSALGVGAFVGAVAALSLTGARRLSPAFLLGVVLWGAPAHRARPLARGRLSRCSCSALIGVGNSLVDVAGLTLVQRAVPDDVLARVFGVIQMLWLAAMGIGAGACAGADQLARLRGRADRDRRASAGLVALLWTRRSPGSTRGRPRPRPTS